MPDDDIPDLTEQPWAAKFAEAEVKRGRPKAAVTKVSTTIRIDADVLQAFRSGGDGWQGRINAALRRAMKLSANPVIAVAPMKLAKRNSAPVKAAKKAKPGTAKHAR